MNVTGDMLCYTCQTSYGFSSAEQRGLIIVVVVLFLVLIACYGSVLWFRIRSRFTSEKLSNVIVDNPVHNNEAFNVDEEQDDEYEQHTDSERTTSTTMDLTHVVVDKGTIYS